MDSRKRTRPVATNGGAKRTKDFQLNIDQPRKHKWNKRNKETKQMLFTGKTEILYRGMYTATKLHQNSTKSKNWYHQYFKLTFVTMRKCSMVGCPFGDGCHFLHHVPGGYNAVLQMTSHAVPAQHYGAPQPAPSGRFQAGHGGPNSPAVKSKLCSRYNTAEGCKFGDKCRFAHGERDLGRPITSHDYAAGPPMVSPMAPVPMSAGGGAPPPGSFGMSATAKISVEASLAGAIIGKGGINTKQICRVTGAKLAIRDHESDPSLKNIELEGTFDQINHASGMVRELIFNVSGGSMSGQKGRGPGGAYTGGGGSNYKTKLCDNFAKGVCTFGEKCNFAHGASEMRQSGTGIV